MSVRFEIIDCQQGSPEWFGARLGLPTASRYKDVIAGGEGLTRFKYMKQLAGEIITDDPMESYTNDKMERGHKHQPDLRTRYCFEREVDVQEVGFIKMNPALCATGCSPDGLVGDDGLVEFKSAEPPVLIDILRAGKPPQMHMAQIHGQLWITGRQWCDLVIGWPKMPLFIYRIHPSEQYIATLAGAVKSFNRELDELVQYLRGL